MFVVDLKVERLRRLLAERSLRQTDLAHLLQVSEAHVSRLLASKRRPGPRLRGSMLAVLGVPFSVLFRGASTRARRSQPRTSLRGDTP
jgi:transcriptional regulator with XRE-family HTH domain